MSVDPPPSRPEALLGLVARPSLSLGLVCTNVTHPHELAGGRVGLHPRKEEGAMHNPHLMVSVMEKRRHEHAHRNRNAWKRPLEPMPESFARRAVAAAVAALR